MASQLTELTSCSICLETFTRPKILPCVHSFCYACLLLLSKKDAEVLTCPQCREKHTIPEEGIAGFRDNTLLNNLLSISEEKEELLCEDCHSKVVAEVCEHCGSNVCGKCFIQHVKLSSELNTSLSHLTTELEKMKAKLEKKDLETMKIELNEEIVKINNVYTAETTKKLEEVRLMRNRSSLLSAFMEVILQIHEDVKTESESDRSKYSQISRLNQKTAESKTTESLKEVKNEVADMETIVRLLQSQKDRFRFTFDADNFGQIEYGQSLVQIRGSYGNSSENFVDRLLELVLTVETSETSATFDGEEDAEVTEMQSARLEAEHDDDGVTRTSENTEAKQSESTSKSLVCGDEKGAEAMSTTRPTLLNQQNHLPTNVDYQSMGENRVTVIGQGGTLIGQVWYTEENWKRLRLPQGFAYHAEEKELYVADSDIWMAGEKKHRFMVYDIEGGDARVFYDCGKEEPRDVAISSDGEYVYLLTSVCVTKVDLIGKYCKNVTECSLGQLSNCVSLICHEHNIFILERRYKCVIVYKDDKQVSIFGMNTLSDPTRMAISNSGEVYIVDKGICVRVFDMNGRYVDTILDTLRENTDHISGIAVDGDGFICLARLYNDRIDVYNSQRHVVATIGRPGNGPGCLLLPRYLGLTPDGRLIIRENNRLQILQ